MNIFKFLNVGQGLFYTGKISGNDSTTRDFRFVYDCGSDSLDHNFYIENAIKGDFYKDESVDIVFLSHLHDDHINGFNELKNFTKIKNVVLPYLYNDPIILYTYLAAISLRHLNDENIKDLDSKFKLLFSMYSKDSIDEMNKEFNWRPTQDTGLLQLTN